MPDYLNYTDEQLRAAQWAIQEEVESRRRKRRLGLFNEAMFNSDDYIKALAVAMVQHYKLVDLKEYEKKLPCRIEDLGYYLAQHRIHRSYSDNPLLTDQFTLWLKITAEFNEFNEVDYIFSNTHFDECSNGHFFRRS